MTTKAFRREIASLSTPKGRKNHGAFLAEGTKCVLDTIEYFNVRYVIATKTWLEVNRLPAFLMDKVVHADRGELGEMSSMSLTPDVIAVYDIPQEISLEEINPDGALIIALDRIQDPGNLGTIMRTADWMGVSTILASSDTVDCYNPKVVQATMGAISRVRVVYGNLQDMFAEICQNKQIPIYGTFLDGENIYTASLSAEGIIVMGNEGKGISDAIESCVTKRLFIPPFPRGHATSESLNVAAATAIVLSQFRSRMN